jgi:hypothetical protein
MRASAPDWRVWLAAWLFPLKIYTVAALLWLIYWHSILPANFTRGWTGLDQDWYRAASEFATVAGYVRLGYFVVASILVIGGIVQWFTRSHRSAWWSLGFGIGAWVAAIWLCYHYPPPAGIVL